eukprot:7464686-Alexandrium_andersonii.AAC.1
MGRGPWPSCLPSGSTSTPTMMCSSPACLTTGGPRTGAAPCLPGQARSTGQSSSTRLPSPIAFGATRRR